MPSPNLMDPYGLMKMYRQQALWQGLTNLGSALMSAPQGGPTPAHASPWPALGQGVQAFGQAQSQVVPQALQHSLLMNELQEAEQKRKYAEQLAGVFASPSAGTSSGGAFNTPTLPMSQNDFRGGAFGQSSMLGAPGSLMMSGAGGGGGGLMGPGASGQPFTKEKLRQAGIIAMRNGDMAQARYFFDLASKQREAPEIEAFNMPGGMAQDRQWNPATEQWEDMGDPYNRFKPDTGAPTTRTRNVGGGKQIMEEWDRRQQRWNPVGEPFERWQPPKPGAPTVRDFIEGDRTVQKQWNEQAQTWEPIPGGLGVGPRFSPSATGPTPAQQANNAEIEAARRYVERRFREQGKPGETMEEYVGRVSQEFDGFMPNESFDPLVLGAFETMRNAMVGDDPNFERAYNLDLRPPNLAVPPGVGRGTQGLSSGAPPNVRGGGATTSPAAGEPVPTKADGTMDVSKLVKDTVYVNRNGVLARWNGTGFVPVQ